MFEKEADLAETEMLIHCHGDYSKKKNYREGWQEGATFGYNKAYGKLNEVKKCLGDIVYMTENNLHTKNELAFARIIAKAKDLLKKE